jgi:uncharacterized protein (DUF1800 family)
MALTQQKVQHLYWRAGFGLLPKDIAASSSQTISNLVEQIFKKSRQLKPIQVVSQSDMVTKKDLKNLSRDEKKELAKKMRELVKDLNVAWIDQITHTEAFFLEKMTIFWHNHFACYVKNAYAVQIQNNTLRKYALGNFKDLLLAVSKDPAMLQYLNNQQNVKKSPNENFAREVLELFTIGRGNYSEKDVKEAARAFTGWGFNEDLKFVSREILHDNGEKTFMGKSGNFKGEDILDIVLENPKTALFITKKVYRFFVNENIKTSDNQIIEKLAKQFFASNYDILDLMKTIFTSDWFYDEKNIGCQIKSPVELLVGFKKTFQVEFNNEKADLFVQKALGQLLLYPPNVAGWAGGKNWIDSSTLLFRLRLGETILNQIDIDFSSEHDGDVDTEKIGKNNKQIFTGKTNLQEFQVIFNKTTNSLIFNELESFLLQKNSNIDKDKFLSSKFIDKNDFLKQSIVQLLSVPEYQVC